MKKNQSIVREIKRKITGLFAIFMLLVTALVGYSLFKQEAAFAIEDLKRSSASLAYDFKSQVNELIYQVAPLSEDRILAELPDNLLFTQNAVKALTNIVDSNTWIKSAFISDGSPFIVEGYPFYTLVWSSDTFTNYTNRVLSTSRRELIIDKLVVPSSELKDFDASEALLFLAVPLRRNTSSLMRPFAYTGVLFIEINIDAFVKQNPQVGDIRLTGNGKNLHPTKTTTELDNPLKTEVFVDKLDGVDVTLALSRQASDFSGQALNAVTHIGLLASILLLLLFLYLKHLTLRLSTPLVKLEQHCKKLESGNYSLVTQDLEFKELNTLQRTLNQLAERIKQQIGSLNSARLKAESSERAKTNFLANMSHELRTPLNGIFGVFQLMKHHKDAKNSDELIEQGLTSTRTLLALLNDLLDFSKIEAGELNMEHINVDIIEIVKALRQEFSYLASQKQIKLSLDHSKLLHPIRVGDPLRITQILRNLVSNSIKFTQQGEISIAVYDNEQQIFFRVTDTGIGMTQQVVEKLFGRFQQADASTTRRYGGTGLGLSIVKQLSEMMNGSVSVTSEENSGSTFIVSLELPISQESSMQPMVGSANAPDLTGKTVLLAEDNELNQRIFTAMLKLTGAHLIIANDGEEALEKYQQIKPDLFFVDIQMPKKDGLDVCSDVRKLDKSTPLIAITANVMNSDINQYHRIGFNKFVAKPIEMSALYKVICELLSEQCT
ncbi:ATP-binding protein [Pseudoalteromonas sp. T1lg65]|uniref:ATP-binding protein n=1 Tax=Pseudoalteromonas sp. T1lg65 TaxID=2077101 RepID=UPI003F79B7CC